MPTDTERLQAKVARQPGVPGQVPTVDLPLPASTNPARTEKMGLADAEHPETAEEAVEAEKARTKRRIDRDIARNKGETIEPADGEVEAIETERNHPLEPPETEEQVKERESKSQPKDNPASIAPQDTKGGFDRDQGKKQPT